MDLRVKENESLSSSKQGKIVVDESSSNSDDFANNNIEELEEDP